MRANAGAASFRRQASLQEHLSEASELLQTIKTQTQADPGQAQAARLRAAQEREQRIQAALEQLPEVAAARKRNGGKAEDARASTTDPEAAGHEDGRRRLSPGLQREKERNESRLQKWPRQTGFSADHAHWQS